VAQSNFGFGYIATYGERKIGIKKEFFENPTGKVYLYFFAILFLFFAK
jgi:hypothetical protein